MAAPRLHAAGTTWTPGPFISYSIKERARAPTGDVPPPRAAPRTRRSCAHFFAARCGHSSARRLRARQRSPALPYRRMAQAAHRCKQAPTTPPPASIHAWAGRMVELAEDRDVLFLFFCICVVWELHTPSPPAPPPPTSHRQLREQAFSAYLLHFAATPYHTWPIPPGLEVPALLSGLH